MAQARSQGVQEVLENPPFYEPPFLENMTPHSYYKSCNKPQLSEYSTGPTAGRSRETGIGPYRGQMVKQKEARLFFKDLFVDIDACSPMSLG